jgi:hypothetical protein
MLPAMPHEWAGWHVRLHLASGRQIDGRVLDVAVSAAGPVTVAVAAGGDDRKATVVRWDAIETATGSLVP